MKINEYFDQVYCLNLDRRPDRMEKMQKRFDHFGIQFKRIQAIDGKCMTDAEFANNKFSKKINKNTLACALGHQKIFEDAKLNNHQKILIFEDDAMMVKDLKIKLQKILTIDWDLIYLGATHYGGWSKVLNGFYHPKSTCGTFAYALNKKAYEWIIDSINKFGFKHADSYLADYYKHQNKKCFIFFPNICKPTVDDADMHPRNQLQADKKFKWNMIEGEII
jgi:GR25 family glycosyltransferase involved in LPS biosynthesis